MSTSRRTKAQAAPATEAPTPENTPCRCGCGLGTIRPDAFYLPGHDARHAGAIGRQAIAEPNRAEDLIKSLPSDRLRAKAQAMIERDAHQRADRERRAAAREAARALIAEMTAAR